MQKRGCCLAYWERSERAFPLCRLGQASVVGESPHLITSHLPHFVWVATSLAVLDGVRSLQTPASVEDFAYLTPSRRTCASACSPPSATMAAAAGTTSRLASRSARRLESASVGELLGTSGPCARHGRSRRHCGRSQRRRLPGRMRHGGAGGACAARAALGSGGVPAAPAVRGRQFRFGRPSHAAGLRWQDGAEPSLMGHGGRGSSNN